MKLQVRVKFGTDDLTALIVGIFNDTNIHGTIIHRKTFVEMLLA